MLPFLSPLERTLGIRVPSMGMFRDGLGLNGGGAYPGAAAGGQAQSRFSRLFSGMDGVDGIDDNGRARISEEPDLEAGLPEHGHESEGEEDETAALFLLYHVSLKNTLNIGISAHTRSTFIAGERNRRSKVVFSTKQQIHF